MPMSEYLDWSAYAQIEPFGSHVDDLRAGTVAAAVYNVHRDPEQRREPYAPLDFAPWNALEAQLQADEVQATEQLDAEALSRLIDRTVFGT